MVPINTLPTTRGSTLPKAAVKILGTTRTGRYLVSSGRRAAQLCPAARPDSIPETDRLLEEQSVSRILRELPGLPERAARFSRELPSRIELEEDTLVVPADPSL